MDGIRLSELARQLGLEVEGDPDRIVSGVGSLEDAGPDDLVFIRSAQLAGRLAGSRARAVVAPEDLDVGDRSALRSPDPGRDFYRAARMLVPEPAREPGVHPSAVVAEDARIDPSASIGALCAIGHRASVGPRTVLHPGVVLSDGATVGADCELGARCVVAAASVLGDRVVLNPGVVLGGGGFGLTGAVGGGLVRAHDIGRVRIGDDVEIGANTTIDRGTLGDTRIGRGTKIDNQVQIGHNCTIGENCIVVAQCGIAGSVRMGDGVVLMAQVGVAGHLELGEGAFVGPKAGVHKSLPAGARVMGMPHRDIREYRRVNAALGHLPDLLRRVRALERDGAGEGE